MPSRRKISILSSETRTRNVDDYNSKKKPRKNMICVFVVQAITAAFIIIVFLQYSVGNQKTIQNEAFIEYVVTLNKSYNLGFDSWLESSKKNIILKRTPQEEAMEWMMKFFDFKNKKKYFLQRYALAVLYFSTSPRNWKKCSAISSSVCHESDYKSKRFLSDESECRWYGVNCHDGYVTWIDLTHNGLRGKIPDELRFLSKLELLWLSGNLISGSIPSWIDSYSNLQSLSLYHTKMSGSLPDEFYRLKNLTSLRLYHSHFEGRISPQISNFQSLTWFWIHQNKFTGGLPHQLADMHNLQSFTYFGNKFIQQNQDLLCNLRKDHHLEHLWQDCDSQGSCACCSKCYQKHLK